MPSLESNPFSPPDTAPLQRDEPAADDAAPVSPPRRLAGRLLRPLAGAIAAIIVGIALYGSGSLISMAATLEVMGFDPDRAKLIADLVAAALAVAVGTLLSGSALASGLAGMAVGAALFSRTFLRESADALASNGPLGRFDPFGWGLTIVTLVVAFAVVAWAVGALALIARGWLLAAGRDAAAFARGRHALGLIRRPVIVLVVLSLLAVTLPVFADLVNYSPDAHMRGGPGSMASMTGASDGTQAVSFAPVPSGPTVLAPAEASAGGGSAAVVKGGSPWLAWKPSGVGRVVGANLPAPWVGGQSSTAAVDVYLPAGYDSSGRNYPVIYAVPWAMELWTKGANFQTMLDTMIADGQMPPSIVVFVAQEHGPVPDTECINAANGQEWFETFIVKTVVQYVDSTFRTVANPAARAVMGFSQGGFCSTMLVLRHPDVFATAIAMSGYYQAGAVSVETPNAHLAFGGDLALEASYSPLRLASTLSPAERSRVFLILEGDTGDPFYGAQYQQMIAAAHAAGIALAEVPSTSGHGWPAVREHLPLELQLLGQRLTALGVFS